MSKWDVDNFTINERIKSARKTVQRARLLRGKATTPRAHAIYTRVIALFEEDERRLLDRLHVRELVRREVRAQQRNEISEGVILNRMWPARKPTRK